MTEANMARVVEENYDKAAEFYDASPLFRLFAPRLVELADLSPGARVLDVATGTGAVLMPAAEKVGAEGRVVGIDVAGPMVERARIEIQRRGIKNAEAWRMDAIALDFPDASFDAAVCGFSLWYIPDVDQALSEIWRVLRPGGRFAVSTWGPQPDLYRRYNELFRVHGGKSPNLSSHDLQTPHAVSALLTRAGFRVLHSAAEELIVTYADEQTWWEQRPANQQVNDSSLAPDELRRFKAAAFEMVQGFKSAEGIQESRSAVYALAERPKDA